MSCHFHLIRRRKAAQAAQEAKNDSQSVLTHDTNTDNGDGEKTQQEAVKSRRRAPREKGDAK